MVEAADAGQATDRAAEEERRQVDGKADEQHDIIACTHTPLGAPQTRPELPLRPAVACLDNTAAGRLRAVGEGWL